MAIASVDREWRMVCLSLGVIALTDDFIDLSRHRQIAVHHYVKLHGQRATILRLRHQPVEAETIGWTSIDRPAEQNLLRRDLLSSGRQ